MIYCDVNCDDSIVCDKTVCKFDTAVVTCAHIRCNVQLKYPINNTKIPIYCNIHAPYHKRRGQPIYREGTHKKSSRQSDLSV